MIRCLSPAGKCKCSAYVGIQIRDHGIMESNPPMSWKHDPASSSQLHSLSSYYYINTKQYNTTIRGDPFLSLDSCEHLWYQCSHRPNVLIFAAQVVRNQSLNKGVHQSVLNKLTLQIQISMKFAADSKLNEWIEKSVGTVCNLWIRIRNQYARFFNWGHRIQICGKGFSYHPPKIPTDPCRAP